MSPNPQRKNNRRNRRNKSKNRKKFMVSKKVKTETELETCYLFGRYHKILVGNYGIENLCRRIHTELQNDYADDSDSEIDDYLDNLTKVGPSVDQLIYVVVLCHAIRCYKLGNELGYHLELNEDMSYIQRCLESILLPSILCDYIEAIGRVELKNGVTVVPWFAPRDEFYSRELGQLTPEMVLERAGRSIHEKKRDWCIDWNIRSLAYRLSSPHLKLRNIKWDKIEGSIEMITTTMAVNQYNVTVLCPQKITRTAAQLGALYNFRRSSEESSWPADTLDICQHVYSVDDMFTFLCLNVPNGSHYILPHQYRNQILVGNYGVEQLCRNVYQKHKYSFTLDQLIYVMIICHCVRCYQINGHYHPDIFYFQEHFAGLHLPSILCRYIEAIGTLDLEDNITVVPWFGSKAEFYSSNLQQLKPEEVLQRAGRPTPDNSWCIDFDWIRDFAHKSYSSYNNTLPPFMQLRPINWKNKKGSIEMMITSEVEGETSMLRASSPCKCLEVEAERGAFYNYRRFSEKSSWPEDTRKFCQNFFISLRPVDTDIGFNFMLHNLKLLTNH